MPKQVQFRAGDFPALPKLTGGLPPPGFDPNDYYPALAEDDGYDSSSLGLVLIIGFLGYVNLDGRDVPVFMVQPVARDFGSDSQALHHLGGTYYTERPITSLTKIRRPPNGYPLTGLPPYLQPEVIWPELVPYHGLWAPRVKELAEI